MRRLPIFLLSLCVYLGSSAIYPLMAQVQEDTASTDERFVESVRYTLRLENPSGAVCTMETLGRMAEESRAAGEPLTLVRQFAADLGALAISGQPQVRGLAARTLAQIEPPMRIAVPPLTRLLHDEDAQLRRAAADSLAQLLQNELNAADPISRPASRSSLILVASAILPAVHTGLEDVQPEVRRRCLETIGLACAALTRLMDEPADNGDPSARRSLQAEHEELRPLLSALHDRGPILERFLHHDDPETRILTNRALEELGVARIRWMRRCAARREGADEQVLGELLHEAVPQLAEELAHPDVRVRRSALDVLEMSGSLALPALPALAHALRDPDRFVRWSAVRTVGKLGPSVAPETRADLTRLLRDPDVDLRKAAASALDRLQAPPLK